MADPVTVQHRFYIGPTDSSLGDNYAPVLPRKWNHDETELDNMDSGADPLDVDVGGAKKEEEAYLQII